MPKAHTTEKMKLTKIRQSLKAIKMSEQSKLAEGEEQRREV